MNKDKAMLGQITAMEESLFRYRDDLEDEDVVQNLISLRNPPIKESLFRYRDDLKDEDVVGNPYVTLRSTLTQGTFFRPLWDRVLPRFSF